MMENLVVMQYYACFSIGFCSIGRKCNFREYIHGFILGDRCSRTIQQNKNNKEKKSCSSEIGLYGFFTFKERRCYMGFRTKDEVIYSRVTGSIRREFNKQMEESGYKSSSDFIEYLLRVNKGKQVDGVTPSIRLHGISILILDLPPKKPFGMWKNRIKMWKTEC